MRPTSTGDRKNMFYWQVDRPFNAKEVKEVFLDRHEHINEENVRAVIKHHFPEKTIENLDLESSGSVNSVLPVSFTDGSKVIIRMHPNDIENHYFYAESLVAKKLIEQGVPCYKTITIDTSKALVNFDYMIYEYLEGTTVKKLYPLSEEIEASLSFQVGQLLAKVHTIKTEKYGFFDNNKAKEGILEGLHEEWKGHIFASLDENLAYLANENIITEEQAKKLKLLFEETDFSCAEPCIIHNDVADWNMIAKDGKITGLLDLDECFSGDPICEFATLSLFFDESRMKNVYEGYGTLPDNFEVKFHLYRMRYLIGKLKARVMKLKFKEIEQQRKLVTSGLKYLKEEMEYFKIYTQ